jgi:hypothetical protein
VCANAHGVSDFGPAFITEVRRASILAAVSDLTVLVAVTAVLAIGVFLIAARSLGWL